MHKRMLLGKVALIFVVLCINKINGYDDCDERINIANREDELAKNAVLHCLCSEGNLQNDVCRTKVERFMNISAGEVRKDDCYRQGAIFGGTCTSISVLVLAIIVCVTYKKRYDILNMMSGCAENFPLINCLFCNTHDHNEIRESTSGLFEMVTDMVKLMLAQVMDEMNRKRIIYILPEKSSVDEQAKELR